MSIDHLRSSFLGFPLQNNLNQRNYGSSAFVLKHKLETRVSAELLCPRESCRGCHAIKVLQFGRRNGEIRGLSSRNLVLGSRLKVHCVNEPFSRSRALIRGVIPPCREGLLLVRCSVFVAVISVIGMLIWYGQVKARTFVEVQLLPSICSILSNHLHRDITVGKVQRISPLSISLQSCSIGPHHEEFSCGESPMMKLRLRPFASLRRGKIVIDTVLSHPSVLIAQKEDFSWLGIPSPSENGYLNHSSKEEGIDYRTKTRRVAREEAAAQWAGERSSEARKAAEMGYISHHPQISDPSTGDESIDSANHSTETPPSASFLCTGDRMLWRDHHCMDMGIGYGSKHADLEKSFGVKIPLARFKFWPGIRHRFRRKVRKKDLSSASVTVKRRILEQSAAAALAYFRGSDSGKPSDAQDEEIVVKNKENSSGNTAELLKNEEHVTATWNEELLQDSFPCSLENFSESVDVEKQVKQASFEIPTLGRRGGVVSPSPKNASMEHGIISGEEFPNRLGFMFESFLMAIRKISRTDILSEKYPLKSTNTETGETSACNSSRDNLRRVHIGASHVDSDASSNGLHDSMQGTIRKGFEGDKGHESQDDIAQVSNVGLAKIGSSIEMSPLIQIWPSSWNFNFPFWPGKTITLLLDYLAHHFQEVKSYMSIKPEHFAAEFAEGLEEVTSQGINKMLPVTVDAVYFTGGTLMLLGYGDQEPREMENVRGHVKFQNHYSQVHVQLSGNCKEWRTELTSKVGGWLSADVFVDSIEQKWHANLKIADLFAPLFERILEIPITWSKGRASGEVHVCMSRGETFPNLHGQLDVKGLAFQIIDAPSSFSEVTASLCFRGQRIFLHNASGWFGDVPLEASGDFGINPQDGEFHLMCQVPSVELNALMKTFKMKPLLFPVAGLVTAVFNCQGPLDAPVLVGSGMISRKTSPSVVNFPVSSATEAVMKNKGAGAVAALDRIPFSYVSANFTYNTDNSVADLYGIRASLLDGGEIRGAGNAWICKEGEVDDFALDVNLSGNLSFDKVLYRYLSREIQLMPLKIGDINGETKLSGSLLRPRFDIKWAAPKAEESFSDARGDIFISHEYITINSSSVAFDLYMKVNTSHPDEHWQTRKDFNVRGTMLPAIEGIELDLRMRGFEFFSLISSNPFGSPRPMHLKVNGKIKFQGCVVKYIRITEDKDLGLAKNVRITKEKELGFAKNVSGMNMVGDEPTSCLVGDVSLSGIKLNQLMLAPQLVGSLNVSRENMKLDVTGRPDENLTLEVSGQIHPTKQENFQKKTVVSVSLQKGQLRANICYQPQISVNLEVRHLPLDELELASLRGTVQKAELQLNFQKWRGHGNLSVIRPRFSGVQGEALDVSARWSGDVITIEKTVLEQASSRYELQGEYVLPGTRDRYPVDKVRGGLLKRAMTGHLGSVISSMGRWRMRLEVPGAEVAEMLPLAQLLSRSTDPAVRSRSKDLFMEGLQFVGFYAESLRDQLEAIRRHYISSDEVLGEMKLPGLAELKGRWRGSLDASGGGNGDTRADFDFHGEDWEWGTYKTQRVLAVGAYSNNDGLRLERIFIQRDNATLHADGTFLGPKTNLHFAVLNFPVGLVPTLLQVIESSTTDSVHSHRQLLTPIKGILHMEGDLRGSLAKPECDVQVRLLDGAIGGIDLGRAEVVASITSVRRFLFNANFAPAIQNGHVHIQGSIPITPFQYDLLEEEEMERDTGRAKWVQGWMKDKVRGTDSDVTNKEKFSSDRGEEGWEVHLAESLKGLNWNILDEGEVKIDADIKDGGMMLITALCPYVNWLHGNADIILQVRGTVEQPVVDGTASFHRASVSSPVLPKPLSNFGGTVHVKSNRLCISALESRVSRRGRLLVKGNLPLNPSESFPGDKIDLKCEVLEVRAKNMLSGQVDSQIQVTGSIMQPIVSGMIKLSHGEAYLPHDKGTGAAINRLASNKSSLSTGGFSGMAASGLVSRFFSAEPAPSDMKVNQPSGQQDEVEKKKEQTTTKPRVDVRLMDLKLHLGPELRIVYPLIVNFAVRGELELNGLAHPKWIKPKGILTFENGDVNLVATQVRLKRDHLNIAKFEPDLGLDPTLDLVLVGSEWQFRIQSRASNWQDNLVVTSMRSVEQDVLSPSEAARVFESQLAESLLEGDGQLAFKKLAAATVESLMPKIEGKGEFGQARWRLVYAPQIPSLLSVDSTADPLKSLTNNISFGTEVEVQLGKRLQASISRQMKDSEMAMKWTLLYQLTSRLRILFQSSPSNRLLFEYSATSQD